MAIKRFASPWHNVNTGFKHDIYCRVLITKESNLACATIKYNKDFLEPLKWDWVVFVWNCENYFICDKQKNGFASSLETAQQICDDILIKEGYHLLDDKLKIML